MNIIKKITDDKKVYRDYMKRVKALPKDYQFVFEKINQYIWSYAGGSGNDMLKTEYDLIELFEESAAQGKKVLDVTGTDVATFCDDLIQGNHLWTDHQKKKLNKGIHKLGK